jgi:hypothetical protein
MGKGQFGLIFFSKSNTVLMMVKAGTAVGNKFVGIHMIIILQKDVKVKGPKPLLVKLN